MEILSDKLYLSNYSDTDLLSPKNCSWQENKRVFYIPKTKNASTLCCAQGRDGEVKNLSIRYDISLLQTLRVFVDDVKERAPECLGPACLVMTMLNPLLACLVADMLTVSDENRLIVAPSHSNDLIQTGFYNRMYSIRSHPASYGFVRNKNAYDCAQSHINACDGNVELLIKMDIKNFFNCFSGDMLSHALDKHGFCAKEIESVINASTEVIDETGSDSYIRSVVSATVKKIYPTLAKSHNIKTFDVVCEILSNAASFCMKAVGHVNRNVTETRREGSAVVREAILRIKGGTLYKRGLTDEQHASTFIAEKVCDLIDSGSIVFGDGGVSLSHHMGLIAENQSVLNIVHNTFRTISIRQLIESRSYAFENVLRCTQNTWIGDRMLIQGGRLSPALSNICFKIMDYRLSSYAEKSGFHYARYADDLSFSSPTRMGKKSINLFIYYVSRLLGESGYCINKEKTKVMGSGSRMKIVGFCINSGKPTISKKYRDLVYKRIKGLEGGDMPAAKIEREIESVVGVLSYIRQACPAFADKMMAMVEPMMHSSHHQTAVGRNIEL